MITPVNFSGIKNVQAHNGIATQKMPSLNTPQDSVSFGKRSESESGKYQALATFMLKMGFSAAAIAAAILSLTGCGTTVPADKATLNDVIPYVEPGEAASEDLLINPITTAKGYAKLDVDSVVNSANRKYDMDSRETIKNTLEKYGSMINSEAVDSPAIEALIYIASEHGYALPGNPLGMSKSALEDVNTALKTNGFKPISMDSPEKALEAGVLYYDICTKTPPKGQWSAYGEDDDHNGVAAAQFFTGPNKDGDSDDYDGYRWRGDISMDFVEHYCPDDKDN